MEEHLATNQKPGSSTLPVRTMKLTEVIPGLWVAEPEDREYDFFATLDIFTATEPDGQAPVCKTG